MAVRLPGRQVCPTGPSSVHVGLGDWIRIKSIARRGQSSDNNAYVESAVEVAHALVSHLAQIIARIDALGVTLEEQLDVEKIVVYVDGAAIVGVRFKFELAGPHNAPTNGLGASHSCPRRVCVALGKVLLQLFTGGSGSPDGVRGGTTGTSIGNNETEMMPPPAKRQATDDSSPSSTAKSLLLQAGMPLSICRLVCDLLDATNEPPSDTAITSLEDARSDLACMKINPRSFLFDVTCPQRALDDACLSGSVETYLYGRENEMEALTRAKEKVASHVRRTAVGNGNTSFGNQSSAMVRGSNFLCEAAFISGYAGSGKSSLLRSLERSCHDDGWFVIEVKFEKRATSPLGLVNALNDFFGKWGQQARTTDPSTAAAFGRVCARIVSTLDDDGFQRLCDLMPNFGALYPLLSRKSTNGDSGHGVSSMDKVGSARKRLFNLLHVVFHSVCSAGRPALVLVDDLQWAGSFFSEGFTDFLFNFVHGVSSMSSDTSQAGLLVAGSFRDGESNADGIETMIDGIRGSNTAHVTKLTAGELPEAEVNKLIAARLCLPLRYTRELAEVVHSKTRGNPFFVIQFLRAISHNKMLHYSVRQRRWVWDCDVVDMQMISDGVAELLTASFSHLPSMLMKTVQILSFLGVQVDLSTIQALDSTNEVLSFNMLDQMEQAVKEGILERAGPVYQFTHDIVQQSIYESTPSRSRGLLHKLIGTNLLRRAADNETIHLLASDQINVFCRDGSPNPDERSQFAHCNAKAAKFAISNSSFQQARSYIDAGKQLLDTNHWEAQYPLSLDLFEMSASVSCIIGDTITMSTCLDQVLSHVMTFEDSLNASSMLAKLLASNSKYEEARSNCLEILKNLGEDFPSEVSLPLVQKELPAMQRVFRNITHDQIKQLPPMTDRRKLNAMKFLNMLCMYCVVSKPLLLPLLTCRMVRLMLEYGFCEDAIVGIATAGYSVVLFAEDVQLGIDLGRVSEVLVEASPNKHRLRSRLCNELVSNLKCLSEPWHSCIDIFPEMYQSSLMAGDIENAMICRWSYCALMIWTGAMSLSSVSNHILRCIDDTKKHGQETTTLCAMSVFQTCDCLTGGNTDGGDIKSFQKLNDIGEKTNNPFLLWQTFMQQLACHFWLGEYTNVATLSEKYSEKHPTLQQKRILHILRTFLEGVAFLSLARSTRQGKWRAQGEAAVEHMAQLESLCPSNMAHKSLLLQAELHYLNGDMEWADTAYKASIKSAREHKFVNEEALAYELHGMCCIETGRREKGIRQLRMAVGSYRKWGARRKADELQHCIDAVGLARCWSRLESEENIKSTAILC